MHSFNNWNQFSRLREIIEEIDENLVSTFSHTQTQTHISLDNLGLDELNLDGWTHTNKTITKQIDHQFLSLKSKRLKTKNVQQNYTGHGVVLSFCNQSSVCLN